MQQRQYFPTCPSSSVDDHIEQRDSKACAINTPNPLRSSYTGPTIMATALPTLPRAPSATWSGSSDPSKDVTLQAQLQVTDSKELPPPSPLSPSQARQPLWKRILTGDANEDYETHRGMDSRHIMMIGQSKSFRSFAYSTILFFPRVTHSPNQKKIIFC